jgi:hypothetical protein
VGLVKWRLAVGESAVGRGGLDHWDVVMVGAVVVWGLPSPGVSCTGPRRCPGVSVISSPGGWAWCGSAAIRWTQSRGRPRREGGQTTHACASWSRPVVGHAARSRQRMLPSRRP